VRFWRLGHPIGSRPSAQHNWPSDGVGRGWRPTSPPMAAALIAPAVWPRAGRKLRSYRDLRGYPVDVGPFTKAANCRAYFFFVGDGDDGTAGPGDCPAGTPPPKITPELPVLPGPTPCGMCGDDGRAGPGLPPPGTPPPNVTPDLLFGPACASPVARHAIAQPAAAKTDNRANMAILHRSC
jgi:hypothetical protein